MKTSHRTLNSVISGGIASLLLLASHSALSATLSLANTPLEIVNAVEPNVVVVNDDSGSMDFETMTTEPDITGISGAGGLVNAYVDNNRKMAYTYVFLSGDNRYTSLGSYCCRLLPTDEAVQALIAGGGNAGSAATASMTGLWRGRNNNYNTVFYNPDVYYQKWPGVDSAGVEFTDYTSATANVVRINPYSSTTTYDLTSNTTETTRRPNAAAEGGGSTNMTFTYFPAMYYDWTDDDGSPGITAGDTHVLKEIRTSGCSTGSPATNCPATFNRVAARTDCAITNGDSTKTCTAAEELGNFANWFAYYRRREMAAKGGLGLALENVTGARVGFVTINSRSSNDIQVASMNVSPATGAKKSLMDIIYNVQSSGGTPLLDPLNDTGLYFQCASNNVMGTGSGSPGGAGCPAFDSSNGGQCQQNYAILMTDGFYTDSKSPGNTDADGAGNWDGGAFADGYSDTMADIAMHFYETDLQGSLNDEVIPTTRSQNNYPVAGGYPDTDGDCNPDTMHQHMITYTIGFGVDGTITTMPTDATLAASNAVNLGGGGWTNPSVLNSPQRIDDLRHTAYNGRGIFSSAANPETLIADLDTIFTEIGENAGSASAVAFNTQEIESGTKVFRASFNVGTNTGNLEAINLNSDGTLGSTAWNAAAAMDVQMSQTSDSRVLVTLDPATDAGIAFKWTTPLEGSDSDNGTNGTQKGYMNTPDPAVPGTGDTLGDERVDWVRGQYNDELQNSGTFRDRALTSGRLGDIIHSTPVFVGEPPFNSRSGGAWPFNATASNAANYSTFKSNNSARTQLVYSGANDGIMHAFTASDGTEYFGYVPNMVIKNLPYLTDPNYSHRYFVDGTPSINDIYFTPPTGSTNAATLSWNTVLVSGLNSGGKGYFALNVTAPADLDTEPEAKGNVLWEFTEAQDGAVGSSDLGYSFSQPLISMSNVDDGSGNKRWLAVFGNGYDGTATAGDSALYSVFIDRGNNGAWDSNDFVKISTGYGKAEFISEGAATGVQTQFTDSATTAGTVANGISGLRGIDTDGNGTTDTVYAGDLLGNLYRFDLSSSSTSSWTRTLLFQAKYKATGERQPITTRPIVIKHPTKTGFIVIFGTGSWMTTADATSSSIQSIYGIWDDLSASPEVIHNSTTDMLLEQSFTNQAGTTEGVVVRTLTNLSVNWRNTGASSSNGCAVTNKKCMGWVIDLDVIVAGGSTVEFPGERAIRNIQLRGGIVFVNTVLAKSTTECSIGPGGFQLAFKPENGGAGDDIIFDLNNDGKFTDGDNVGDTSGSANIVTGIRFDGSPTDSSFIGQRRYTQTSGTGSGTGTGLESVLTNTGNVASTGRNSWREFYSSD